MFHISNKLGFSISVAKINKSFELHKSFCFLNLVMFMRVFIGSDHCGVELKEKIKQILRDLSSSKIVEEKIEAPQADENEVSFTFGKKEV